MSGIDIEDLESEQFIGAKSDALIEAGMGLIARGLFRKKEAEGAQAAVNSLDSIRTVLGGIWMDFYKLAQKEARQ